MYFEGDDDKLQTPPATFPAKSIHLYVTVKELFEEYENYKRAVIAFAEELRLEWRKGKGGVGSVFTIMLLDNCLETRCHNILYVYHVVSKVLLIGHFDQNVGSLLEEGRAAKQKLDLFLDHCNNCDAAATHKNFDTYFLQRDQDVCRLLNIGDALGANELLEFRSLKSYKASP
jgi:hypothetical protein